MRCAVISMSNSLYFQENEVLIFVVCNMILLNLYITVHVEKYCFVVLN